MFSFSYLPSSFSHASLACHFPITCFLIFPANSNHTARISSLDAGLIKSLPAPIFSLRIWPGSAPSGCTIATFSDTLLGSRRPYFQSRNFPVCSCSLSSTATSIPEAYGVTESGEFSISDEDMQARGFKLRRTVDNIDLDQLNSLFVKVGFPRRQKEKLRRALQHTTSLLWLEEAKGGKLIAFARATGDDVFNAIIWDVVVDPSYQGLGLGKAIMERLMVDLLRKGISNISLYAEPNVVSFYKPLGYIVDPHGIKAMAYCRKGR